MVDMVSLPAVTVVRSPAVSVVAALLSASAAGSVVVSPPLPPQPARDSTPTSIAAAIRTESSFFMIQ